MNKKRILAVAQTPPPFHGQSIMQKYLVDANWNWCKKEFVRMNFSEEIKEVGVFKIKKLRQLFNLISSVQKKAHPKFELIYYPPGGPHRIPIYRDVIMLYFLRKSSGKIILHFHAGGIDQIFNKVTRIESYFIKQAFNRVDAVIVLSEWLKREVEWCNPQKLFVVANGIDDVFPNFLKKEKNQAITSFLFVGNLKKEKGIFTLLEAAAILKAHNEKFELNFIGSFHSDNEEHAFLNFINENRLAEHVRYLGVKSGNKKWEEFQNADVFCLPTYETEAMPISILEAMMFQIPVITTNWRSIPDIVRHGENGLLFEPKNAKQLSTCMQRLIHDEEERRQMGKQARKDYLLNFSIDQHLRKMEKVFQEALTL
jgi:glycosyltransferase involved in cell wall biosynthesis